MKTLREERMEKAYTGSFPDKNLYAMEALEQKFGEDLGYTGDITYGVVNGDITYDAVLKKNKIVFGVIKAKEEGILAGLEEVTEFYTTHGMELKPKKKDGDKLGKGDIIAEVYGNEMAFLKLERTGLNLMQRMSGIATATKKLADIAQPYGVKIVGTRKTLLNYFDKKAIVVGGGLPHRMGLYDAILIKDNHLEAIREEGVENVIETAVERAYTSPYRKSASFIEIEVQTMEDAIKAAKSYYNIQLSEIEGHHWDFSYKLDPTIVDLPFIIMLDNMKPAEIKNTVKALKKKRLYDFVLLEASGNINEKNLKAYAATGIDAISIGAVTHSIKALDISQKIIRRET